LARDLDRWMKEYNDDRPHQGRWCYGKTPMPTFVDSVPLAKEQQNCLTARPHCLPDQIWLAQRNPRPLFLEIRVIRVIRVPLFLEIRVIRVIRARSFLRSA
jgi:hypothetical protein